MLIKLRKVKIFVKNAIFKGNSKMAIFSKKSKVFKRVEEIVLILNLSWLGFYIFRPSDFYKNVQFEIKGINQLL